MRIKKKRIAILTRLILFMLLICELLSPFYPVSAGVAPVTNSNIKINIVSSAEQKIKSMVMGMTLEQKVGQMFFHMFRRDSSGNNVTKLDKNMEKIIKDYGFGGFILFTENIQNTKQVTDFIKDLQQASSIPMFISIDEEGGRVLRTKALDVPRIGTALSIGNTGDPKNAYNAAKTIAGYLKPLGFNVDFAPVADVFTNPSNTVIGDRAFSTDANQAAEMVGAFTEGLTDNGMLATVKHFPGHGDTGTDSHYGTATTKKTLDELMKCEFIPFQAGIKAGAAFVMTGHITVPNVTGNDLPATFSSYLLKDILRGKLGFEGVVITDALEMGAITKYYTSEETAVNSILAGADMLLAPQNLSEAYNGLIKAVRSGKITEERINESAQRILAAKYKAGLIKLPDNKQATVTAYNINGNNYIKLRDLAYIMNGTAKQFEVSYDAKKNTVSVTSGKPYTVIGGEMTNKNAASQIPAPATAKIYVDGKEIDFTAYNINGNNYFKLRDIMRVFDIYVGYSETADIITVNTAKRYVED